MDVTLQTTQEIFEQLAHLGHALRPDMRNATRGEAAVIMTLHTADSPLTPTEIARRARISQARVANVLGALEKKGWVSREHDSVDRRRVVVSITPEGDAVRAARRRELDDAACAFLNRLGHEDTQELLRILKRCNQIIDEKNEDEVRPHEDPQTV